jgi:hypothetical protein
VRLSSLNELGEGAKWLGTKIIQKSKFQYYLYFVDAHECFLRVGQSNSANVKWTEAMPTLSAKKKENDVMERFWPIIQMAETLAFKQKLYVANKR